MTPRLRVSNSGLIMWYLLISIVMLQDYRVSCGSVTLSSTPESLQPPSTPSLTVRCSVGNYQTESEGPHCLTPYKCETSDRVCVQCYLGTGEDSAYTRCKLLRHDPQTENRKESYRLLVRPGDMTYDVDLDINLQGHSCLARVAKERLGQGLNEFRMEFWNIEGTKLLGSQPLRYSMGVPDKNPSHEVLKEITSISVRHASEVLAYIAFDNKIRLLSDASNLEVSGELNTELSGLGYLELVWTHPALTETGNYECDVEGSGTSGESIVLSESIEVVEEEISLNDLIQSLSVLQTDQQSLRHECSSHLDLSVLVEENQRLKSQVDRLNQSLDALADAMTELAHVETGYLDCGDSEFWRGTDLDYKYKNLTISFTTAYLSPPAVHISVFSRTSSLSAGETYYASLVSVSSLDFTIACGVPTARGRVYSTMVQWISVPLRT